MQVQDVYFNFTSSIKSDVTRQRYEYCLSKFLKHCDLDLIHLLSLEQQELSNLIIRYLSSLKASNQYKNQILAAIKHVCTMNDVILNWKKIGKFITYEKTGNELNADRGYSHEEIQQILKNADLRLKTAFIVLASTGIRIGALSSIKLSDLEQIDNLYKVTVYAGDREEYITFTTPECKKVIDDYLDHRKKKGETITQDSYLIVRKFCQRTEVKGLPFRGMSLWAMFEKSISMSSLDVRQDRSNNFKRKKVAMTHGFRKFFTKQLVDSKLNPEIREMLLGHKIGLTGVYYKPTEQEMLNEYLKAVNLLTINEEYRLRKKIEQVQIEKSQFEALRKDFELFKKELRSKR